MTISPPPPLLFRRHSLDRLTDSPGANKEGGARHLERVRRAGLGILLLDQLAQDSPANMEDLRQWPNKERLNLSQLGLCFSRRHGAAEAKILLNFFNL